MLPPTVNNEKYIRRSPLIIRGLRYGEILKEGKDNNHKMYGLQPSPEITARILAINLSISVFHYHLFWSL